MNDWNIQARARTCQGCGKSFGDREAYHTILQENRSTLERLDVCVPCWDGQHRHGATERKGFVSHWQGVFSVPPPPPPDPIQRDNAESLLRRLIERNDPRWQPASFILAVMLERKRILRIREQFRQRGRRTFVYELPRSGDVFVIQDPDLQLHQLEQVQHDVARLLEHGLPLEPNPVEEPFIPESPGTPLFANPTDSSSDLTPAVSDPNPETDPSTLTPTDPAVTDALTESTPDSDSDPDPATNPSTPTPTPAPAA